MGTNGPQPFDSGPGRKPGQIIKDGGAALQRNCYISVPIVELSYFPTLVQGPRMLLSSELRLPPALPELSHIPQCSSYASPFLIGIIVDTSVALIQRQGGGHDDLRGNANFRREIFLFAGSSFRRCAILNVHLLESALPRGQVTTTYRQPSPRKALTTMLAVRQSDNHAPAYLVKLKYCRCRKLTGLYLFCRGCRAQLPWHGGAIFGFFEL